MDLSFSAAYARPAGPLVLGILLSQYHNLPLGPNGQMHSFFPGSLCFGETWDWKPHICLANILLTDSSTFHLISRDRVSTEPQACHIGILARLIAPESLGSACLYSYKFWGYRHNQCHSAFIWCWRFKFRSSSLHSKKHFTPELSPQASVSYFNGQILPTFCMAPWFLNESFTVSLLLPSSGMLIKTDKPWNYRVEL